MTRMKTGYRGLRLAATFLLACQVRLKVYGVGRIPRGWKRWHRPRVYVVFGEPYIVKPRQGVPTKAAIAESAAEMARRIASLVPEEYRGYYGMREMAGLPLLDGALAMRSNER